MTVRSRDLKPGDVISRHGKFEKTIKVRKDDDSGWWLETSGGISDLVFDTPGYEWALVRRADEVTITVRRQDIEALIRAGATNFASQVARRIEAAIPAPEWEPTEEQIDAYCTAYGAQRVNREVARADLKAARLVFGL